jgi:phospholipid-translocating ATPase
MVLVVGYTAVYSAFAPSLIWTYVWGNNSFLWPSVYWWLGLALTIILSLAPRYIYMFLKDNYFPTDVDICRAIDTRDPNHDWEHDPYMPKTELPSKFERVESASATAGDAVPILANRPSYTQSRNSFALGRVQTRQSQTYDMATGSVRQGTNAGFQYDEGVALDVSRYTSRGSQQSGAANDRRKRSGSLRVAGLEVPIRKSSFLCMIPRSSMLTSLVHYRSFLEK